MSDERYAMTKELRVVFGEVCNQLEPTDTERAVREALNDFRKVLHEFRIGSAEILRISLATWVLTVKIPRSDANLVRVETTERGFPLAVSFPNEVDLEDPDPFITLQRISCDDVAELRSALLQAARSSYVQSAFLLAHVLSNTPPTFFSH